MRADPDNRNDLNEIKAQLGERWESLCLFLFGEPARRRRREWRWGNKGSAVVRLGGKAGPMFYSHESGEGGSLLDAIMFGQGCAIGDAISWARDWLGGDAQRTAPKPQPQRVSFDADEDEAARIASAVKLWSAGRSAAGTAAARYLNGRGITAFPAGSVRFIGARDIAKELRWWTYDCGALIVPATDAGGAVRGVQLIAVHDDGTPGRDEEGHKLKRSRGSLAGGAVRFPGKDTGPLFLAEGPETALSVWLASGCETWALVGSVGRAPLEGVPANRILIVARDDDLPTASAFTARRNAVSAWRKAGRTVVEATPWALARHDKTDFNDLLQVGGVDAVLARLDAVVAPALALTDETQKPTAEIARATMDDLFKAVMPELLAWENVEGGPAAPCLVAQVGVGLGKTTKLVVPATVSAFKAGRYPVCVTPTHKLNGEILKLMRAEAKAQGVDPTIEIYRGAGADIDPEKPGEKMCAEPAIYKSAVDAHFAPLDTVCRSCPSQDGCPFLAQQGKLADIWIGPVDLIWRKPPRPLGEPDFLVIDEAFAERGLFGVEGAPQIMTREMIETLPEHGSGRPGATADLQADLQSPRAALLKLLVGEAASNLERGAMTAAGLNRDQCRAAAALEWKRYREPPSAKLDREEMAAWLESAAGNRDVLLMVRLWEYLGELAGDAGPDRSGRVIRWAKDDHEKGHKTPDSLRLVGCEPIAKEWRIPTLHCDATASMELIHARVGRRARLIGTAEACTPNMRIHQLTGRFGKGALLEGKWAPVHLAKVWAWILAKDREEGGRWLVIANQEVIDKLLTGPVPPSIEFTHFNALRGLDRFGGVRGIVVLGRPMPSPGAVETIRGALTGRAAPTACGEAYYPLRTAVIMGRDGTVLSADVEMHPDPLTEAVRLSICEAELVQAIGRGRGVNRSDDNPLLVYVLGNTPLPGLPLDHVGRWEPLGLDEAMMAEYGAVPSSAGDCAKVANMNREAVKKARQRARKPDELGTFLKEEYLLRNVPSFGFASYRRTGSTGPASDLAFDATRIRHPGKFLANKIRRPITLTHLWHPALSPMQGVQCRITGIWNFGISPAHQTGFDA